MMATSYQVNDGYSPDQDNDGYFLGQLSILIKCMLADQKHVVNLTAYIKLLLTLHNNDCKTCGSFRDEASEGADEREVHVEYT